MFLNPRGSQVDVVQSVGPGDAQGRRARSYGYIILPIGVPSDMSPEEALRDNKRYKVVWQVLQALRAHDDRFNAMVNKIELNKAQATDKIQVIGVGGTGGHDATRTQPKPTAGPARASSSASTSGATRSTPRSSPKVGDRRYWEDWANDVADIARPHITRINGAARRPDARHRRSEFDGFLDGLRGNLNDVDQPRRRHRDARPAPHHPARSSTRSSRATTSPSTTRSPRPWSGCSPPSTSRASTAETETLDKFYDLRPAAGPRASTTPRASRRSSPSSTTSSSPPRSRRPPSQLGIVYTPVEIVDFILRSADAGAARRVRPRRSPTTACTSSTAFTGTGTFIVRLLQSGLISAARPARKYANELHANEITAARLLHRRRQHRGHLPRPRHGGDRTTSRSPGSSSPTPSRCYEDGDRHRPRLIFPQNNERVDTAKALPTSRVIVGNPPYSVGQDQRERRQRQHEVPDTRRADPSRPTRSARRRRTRTRSTTPTSAPSAGPRTADRATAASSPSSPTAATSTPTPPTACARALVDEFDAIYVFNLRGNQRTAGEQSRKRGRQGLRGRQPGDGRHHVPGQGPADDRGHGICCYRDIGDYLTRREKLATSSRARTLTACAWTTLVPERTRRLAQPTPRQTSTPSCPSATRTDRSASSALLTRSRHQPRRLGATTISASTAPEQRRSDGRRLRHRADRLSRRTRSNAISTQ
ncbi:MAG: hypothetical protein WKF73_11955 [Nocardioidaceae bacterium]